MTNASATSALDFVDAPASHESRCSAGDQARVQAVAIPSAQAASYKPLHSFKCKFPTTMSQRGG
jgi:hypothetical protein